VVTFHVLLSNIADTHQYGTAKRVDGEQMLVENAHRRATYERPNPFSRRHADACRLLADRRRSADRREMNDDLSVLHTSRCANCCPKKKKTLHCPTDLAERRADVFVAAIINRNI